MKKSGIILYAVYLVFWVVMLIGYIKDIVKLCHCDFKAPYKAEALYIVGACTGLGGVIGYININDKAE